MPNVLITTEALREVDGPHLKVLRGAGYEVRYPAKRLLLTEDDTLEAMADCVAVIAGSEPYTDRVLAGLPQLRVISRNGVGYDRIEVPAATRRGVAVTITPEGNHQAVAEHTMALILAVARSIVQSAIETRSGVWRRRGVHVPLRDKTLGIVGLGRIGRSVAVRAKPFGMRIVACETFPNQKFVDEYGIKLVNLETLLAESDFVTLHAPMSSNTQKLVDRTALARMKRGSFLINTARGGLVDEPALIEALRSGHLAGAGLDVLAIEPPRADNPLLALDSVIVTPHVSALDSRAIEDMAVGAAQNIVDIFRGDWPDGALVNPEVKAGWKS